MRYIRLAALLFAATSAASAQSDATLRVSSTPTGEAGDDAAYAAVVSADGSCVAFLGLSTDLVAADTNGLPDVFVFDRGTGALRRVSVDSLGNQSNGACDGWPAFSSDGRFVAFSSDADNLAHDPNGRGEDVFVHDRVTGTTTLVSIGHGGAGADHLCEDPSVDADGARIAFMSLANNLVFPFLKGWVPQVYVRDLSAGVTTLVSSNASGTAANRASGAGEISDDGMIVGFSTNATNLPDSGSNEFRSKSYIKDLVSGAVERVDADSSGAFLDGNSILCDLSSDGVLVLFWSDRALVPEDQNEVYDYYLRDFGASTLDRVSVATGGTEIHPCNSGVFVRARLSGDGRFVVFSSDAPDVVEGHRDCQFDVFVRDRVTAITRQVSLGTLDEVSRGDSFAGGISDDGGVIAFNSYATEFASNDDNAALDAFFRERAMIPAFQEHYGSGHPGRAGAVPSITPDTNPWRGAPIDLVVRGSSSTYTVALLLIGGPRDSIPTGLGGTLLLDVALALPIALSPYGTILPATVPEDSSANGLVVDLQVLELDPWASRGVSFSDGLELTIGDG